MLRKYRNILIGSAMMSGLLLAAAAQAQPIDGQSGTAGAGGGNAGIDSSGAGGTNGSGGGAGFGGFADGSGGAGVFGDGASAGDGGGNGSFGGSSAPSFAGGAGASNGSPPPNGGFGGGGGGGFQGGGGGGGYSGGGGGSSNTENGGGGGSYISSLLTANSLLSGIKGVNDSAAAPASNGYVAINGVAFNYVGSLADYIIPTDGLYDIAVYGAQGGGNETISGGFGAFADATGLFTAGTDLKILVGGGGLTGDIPGLYGGGGGGGSFVFNFDSVPLVVAGGGGGAQYFTTAAVPEPATWGMMLLGLGLAGAAMRRKAQVTRQSVTFG
jgi:hypothetical protein